ncbi:MAG: response regulator [Lachnospiraceae bacterium]|nr:response regulator [Lachnospiraceae bacterium]
MSDWALVVDDDEMNLIMASHILTKVNMRVSCMKSGRDALEFLEKNKPDIILLDIHMPGIDGFETIAAIRKNRETAEIPVIFLTADDDIGAETRGLQSGAMDFIRKPFMPEVFLARIRHTIDLHRLQTSLTREVEKKTLEVVAQQKKIERIMLQVVNALAGAIDAKDTYTNGHSARVAEYSKKIAERLGLSEEEQDELYIIGLLHDVGKIGIPDDIINKTDRLTDEEYAIIKKHPVLGAGILENITDMPKLLTGARWHHERYDGKGYPDGLSGEDIPPEARIIAVADAYDAMSSNRSYRNVMPQQAVREEIEKGKGTQFDPVYADAMLSLIDEDTEYSMKEK